MKTAMLLATVAVLATTASHQRVTLRCADVEKQPDGTWVVVRDTIMAIKDFERQTLMETPFGKGTRFPVAAEATPPAKGDGLSRFVGEDVAGLDVAAKLDKLCR